MKKKEIFIVVFLLIGLLIIGGLSISLLTYSKEEVTTIKKNNKNTLNKKTTKINKKTFHTKTSKEFINNKKKSINIEKYFPFIKYIPGEVIKFSLNYYSEVNFASNLEANKENIFIFKIKGSLVQKIYKKNIIGYIFQPNEVYVTNAAKKDIDKFKHNLAKEIYIKIDKNGKISKFFFPKDIEYQVYNTLKSLCYGIQIVLPTSYKNEWTVQEEDMNGKYIAKYILKDCDDKNIIIHKEKLNYIKDTIFENIESNSEIEINNKGNIQSIIWKESYKYKNSIKGSVFIELKLNQKKYNKELLSIDIEKKLINYISSLKSSNLNSKEERLKKILGNMKWKDFEKEFNKLKKKYDPQKSTLLFRKLIALLELHPENIKNVKEEILKYNEYDKNLSILINALGNIDNPKAQETLIEIAQKKFDNKSILSFIIASLGDTPHPNSRTIEFLQDLSHSTSGNIQNTIYLTLGSLASKIKDSESIISDLNKSLSLTQEPHKKIVLLEALGNAGSPQSLPYIKNYLSSKDEQIKRTAITSLRFIPTNEVDIIISRSLEKENNNKIKNALLDTLSYRVSEIFNKKEPPKELFKGLSDFLSKEKSPYLRLKSAKLLWDLKKYFPSAKSIIEYYSKNDPSPQVRENLKLLMMSD